MQIYYEVLGSVGDSFKSVTRFDNVDDAKWQAVKSLLQFKKTCVIKTVFRKRFIFFGEQVCKTSTVARFSK